LTGFARGHKKGRPPLLRRMASLRVIGITSSSAPDRRLWPSCPCAILRQHFSAPVLPQHGPFIMVDQREDVFLLPGYGAYAWPFPNCGPSAGHAPAACLSRCPPRCPPRCQEGSALRRQGHGVEHKDRRYCQLADYPIDSCHPGSDVPDTSSAMLPGWLLNQVAAEFSFLSCYSHKPFCA